MNSMDREDQRPTLRPYRAGMITASLFCSALVIAPLLVLKPAVGLVLGSGLALIACAFLPSYMRGSAARYNRAKRPQRNVR